MYNLNNNFYEFVFKIPAYDKNFWTSWKYRSKELVSPYCSTFSFFVNVTNLRPWILFELMQPTLINFNRTNDQSPHEPVA